MNAYIRVTLHQFHLYSVEGEGISPPERGSEQLNQTSIMNVFLSIDWRLFRYVSHT